MGGNREISPLWVGGAVGKLPEAPSSAHKRRNVGQKRNHNIVLQPGDSIVEFG